MSYMFYTFTAYAFALGVVLFLTGCVPAPDFTSEHSLSDPKDVRGTTAVSYGHGKPHGPSIGPGGIFH